MKIKMKKASQGKFLDKILLINFNGPNQTLQNLTQFLSQNGIVFILANVQIINSSEPHAYKYNSLTLSLSYTFVNFQKIYISIVHRLVSTKVG